MARFARRLVALALLFAVAAQAQAPSDWTSPKRLVRLDSVEAAGVAAFEGARRAWASADSADGRTGAGLAHAWSGTDGEVTHYLMMSPFNRYADLDAYGDLDGGGSGRGGNAYADAPHHVEVWQRIDALGFPSAADPGLGELTAGAARIEIVTEVNARERADLVATWKDIAAALASQKYQLASVVYENRFVSGQLVRIWYAKDLAALKSAPSLKTSITWAEGDRRARDLTVRANQLTEIERHFIVERRADLSAGK